ncbi:DUF805 domain-containing protein [Enterococcus sp. CWB-B31]|uniref:DUF805 domain-containing protein n=1 Tax=Enterococcus sp. CWB-B31 TaxID=2885159 RepID=UPI001E3BA7D3|nr:DUF805 domain-containing protein [Enterococcus sp. CWB-B31]MCB5956082.1 DUF805 domain-containing protein [Enterococcus sp. CWB-B31]
MGKINQKPGEVSFVQAIKDFFLGYVDFKGRTTRAGYWWVTLILSLGGFVMAFAMLGKIFSLVFSLIDDYGYYSESEIAAALTDSIGVFILFGVISLALILPTLALSVRRYRDAGVTGRGVLTFYIINFVGNIINLNGSSAFLTLIVSAISIFFFILSILPTDSLVTTSNSDAMQFFFRKKQEKDSEWVEY